MTARTLAELPAVGDAVITLGAFDGVHLGHRELIARTVAVARDRGATPVAIVFEPHPDEVLRPGTVVRRVLPPAATTERLGRAGATVVELRFDDALRGLAPEDFVAALGPALRVVAITMAPDAAFGRARSGTPERLTEIGLTMGFDVVTVDPVRFEGEPVSSSRIRRSIEAGDIERASAMLGTAPLLRGTVVSGDRRGRTLGFPTANLEFSYAPALPALGIYLGRLEVPDRGVGPGHPALVSVGVRPTFHDDGRVLVEAYLLDWDGDLYDATADVEIVARLREERRFSSAEALVVQMRADEEEARRLIRP